MNYKETKSMKVYTVLLVEDEKDIADAVEVYLRNQGYEVIKQVTGKKV